MKIACTHCGRPREWCVCGRLTRQVRRYSYRGRHHMRGRVVYSNTTCRREILTRPKPPPVGRVCLGAGVVFAVLVAAFGVVVPDTPAAPVPASAAPVATAAPAPDVAPPPAPVVVVQVARRSHVVYRRPVVAPTPPPVLVRKVKHKHHHDTQDGD